MKKFILTLCFLGFSIVILQAQTMELFFEQANEFLRRHVTPEGKVDYFNIKKSPGELIYILDNIKEINTKDNDKEAAKAFWINVYNLQVIKFVVDVYPIATVEKIPGFFDEKTFIVGNLQLTLDDVENVILRDLFTDPAIHFAISCAANGGAKLLNKVYLPSRVNDQIKEQARLAINSDDYFIIDKSNKTIKLPKIFEWYKDDFAVGYFNEIDFINLFLDRKVDNKYSISTYDFDWSINSK